jgi:hypothetical protein
MDSSGLSWPAFASCGIVLCISLGLTLFAVAGCCRRRPVLVVEPAAAVAAVAAARHRWIAVAHPGGEIDVGCQRFSAKGCPA